MTIHDKTKELFSAVIKNDYHLTYSLITAYGIDLLNSQDLFGTTALHLAVKYGHEDLVQLLVSQPNINPNLQAYQDNKTGNTYSSLDFALKYDQPPKIIELLLDVNATTQHPDVLLSMILGGENENSQHNEASIDDELINQYLSLFKKIIAKIPELSFMDGWPLSCRLTEQISHSSDPETKIVLQQIVEILSELDLNNYAHLFLSAKNFTHAFPSSNKYSTINQFIPNPFLSEGHLKYYTLKSFHSSFLDYQHILETDFLNNLPPKEYRPIETWIPGNFLDISNYHNFKKYIFSEINSSYTITEDTILNYGLYDTSILLFESYNEGKTLLLHSDWEGHAIDIILDKNLNLYIVANAGERYSDLPSGVIAYNHKVPITADSIYKILNYHNQHNLEYDQYYDLQLNENPVFSQEFPNQEYGNCALNSLLLTNWSLTYLNLYKNMIDPLEAKLITNIWHNDVVEHHKTLALKNYLTEPYLKEDQPLYDALIKYESTLDHPEKIAQTQLILDYLTTSEHLMAFKDYYDEHQTDFSSDLNAFIQDNGYGEILRFDDILLDLQPQTCLTANLEPAAENTHSIEPLLIPYTLQQDPEALYYQIM